MENEKNAGFEEDLEEKEDFPADTASRARNRTVMLTPEITGEVRARLQQDLDKGPPSRGTGAFEPPQVLGGGSSYSPARSGGGFEAPSVRGGASHGAPARGPQTAAPVPEKEGVVWTKETPLIGFLVSFDQSPNGTVFELRSGRLIVTSEAAGVGNYLLVNDKSVSPMHAIMRISATGEIQVLDQLSEFGTRVQRFGSTEEEELSGDKTTLEHGDVIKFGNRSFSVCTIARSDQA